MPDASGRFKGIAVPASAPWPPERPLPPRYVPADERDDAPAERTPPEPDARR